MATQKASGAVVVGPSGHTSGEVDFGDFLKSARKARATNVTHLTKQAGLSRANYYHLESGQAPSLPTAIALLSALGMETRLPVEDDQDWDLEILDGEDHYRLRIRNWTDEERRRSRARMTSAGFSFSPWGGVRAAALIGMPGVAAGALAAKGSAEAARLLRRRAQERKAARLERNQPAGQEVASDEQVRNAFFHAAEDMSTEDLEALLEAMKAMHVQGEPEG